MAAWVQVTLDDLRAEAANARIEAAVANDTHEVENYFARIRDGVVAEVRTAIASCASNTLDATASTVPPEWRRYVCLRILAAWMARAGQGEESTYRLTDDQRTELERRYQDLALVRTCDLAVTTPDSVAAPAHTSLESSMRIVGGTRRYTRDEMDGL